MFTRTDLPGERQVYRTSGSLVAWWAWVTFAVVLLIVLAFGHHDHAALVTASVVITITGIMYACALQPRIVADVAGIAVVNPLRVHEVPWPAVTQVDLAQNIRVHYRDPAGGTPGGEKAGGTPGGEKIVHSWAVQSTGRSKTRSELRARRAARRGMTAESGYARLPDAAQAALAGSAAEFIARQLDERAQMQRSAAPSAGPGAAGPGAAGSGAAGSGAAGSGAAGSGAAGSGSAAAAGPGGAPDAAPAVARVRWNWGPIAAMVVPLLLLLALTLA